MTAKEFLEQTSPNNKYGLRAELQKHRLRRMVEKEMEMYHEHKLKLLGISHVVERRELLTPFKCPNCGNNWNVDKVDSCE